MRLLVITYELDRTSNVLAWQADVVAALAKHCEFILAVTSNLGQFEPPDNVKVLQIPIRPYGIPQKLGGHWLVNFDIYQLCRKYCIQAAFVHMASDWVYILAPTFRLLGMPVLFWYAHGTVTQRLKVAHRLADKVVTSTPEGFRIPSSKTHVIGQGVDTGLFDVTERLPKRSEILYVGRVSPRKRVDLLIEVMACLVELSPDAMLLLRIVGPQLTSLDHTFCQRVQDQIRDLALSDRVTLVGPLPQAAIVRLYQSAFLHLNLSQTGSMDKTVVEALSCGCPVLTSNEAFFDMLSEYPDFLLSSDDPSIIAKSVLRIYKKQATYDPQALRSLVIGHHDLNGYTEKIYGLLDELIKP